MSSCDFIYRGENLSDHGYVMCNFDNSSNARGIITDSQRTYASVPMFMGKKHPILYYTYNNALNIEFSICKDSDEDIFVSPTEAADIKRWLHSPIPLEFRMCDEEYEGYFWVGVFNIEEVRSYDRCVGFNLTFTTTSPFGYKDTLSFQGTTTENGTITINDTSDEEGYIYPDISLKILSPGDLELTNSFDNRTTQILGCLANEEIRLTRYLQVFTSVNEHKVYDDFNYKFVRISNNYGSTENVLTVSLPCEYTITYNPIAKVVFS